MTKIINSFFKTNKWLNHFNKNKYSYIFLLASCFILYGNTITHDYALDDQLAIYDNKFVTQGLSGIPDILTTDAFVGFFGERGSTLISGGRYRPLSYVTFAAEWEMFDRAPHISHFINVLLYALLAWSIFYYLSLLFSDNDVFSTKYVWLSFSLLATILYVYHPIHTEVVANIKGRDEILCFLFSIWALILWLSPITDSKNINFLLIASSFFLGLMSKENAITFLGVVAIVQFYKYKWTDFKTFSQPFLPFLLATIVYLILRSSFTLSGLGDESSEVLNNPFVHATSAEKWATILFSYIKYLGLLLFPVHLTHDYYFNHIPLTTFSNPWVILSIVIIIASIVYLARTKWFENKLSYSIAFFMITFSVFSNIVFTVGIIMNERFIFIASLGFSIIFVLALLVVKRRISEMATLFFIGIILLLYSFKTIDRNKAWENNFSLFATDYRISNNSAKVATAYGGVLYEKAKTLADTTAKRELLDSAIKVITHAIEIYPTHGQSRLLLANMIYERNNNVDEAIQYYKQALGHSTGFFDAEYNLGIMYYNKRQFDSAQYYLDLANRDRPNTPEVTKLLADVLSKLGKTGEALQYSGNDVSQLARMSLNSIEAGNANEALRLADQVLATDPNNGTANYVKGLAISRFQNNLAGGIPYLEKSINSPNPHPKWFEDLAVAYGMSGRIQETIPLLEKAIALDPNSKQAYLNLAASYGRLGNKQKADYYMQLANSK